MASDSRKYFDAAQDRKNDLSKEFGAAHASDDKPYDLSAVVEAANNFLGGYAPQTAADVQRLLYDAATNPGSLGASVMVTSHMPNVTPEEQKKKEDEAHHALMLALQEQIRQANERISKMIDECREMAEWCREQARKLDESIKKITEEMSKEGQFLHDADEMLEGYRGTGKIDKDKARRMLLERGIKTKGNESDAKLAELLEKERLKSSQHYNDLNELKERSEKLKEAWKEQEKAYEEKGRKWEEKKKDLNNGQLEPQEQKQKLDELEKKLADEIEKLKAAKEAIQKAQQQIDSKLEEKLDQSKSKENASDFAEASLEPNEKDRSSMGKHFTSAAEPSAEKPAIKNESLEAGDKSEPGKQVKISIS